MKKILSLSAYSILAIIICLISFNCFAESGAKKMIDTAKKAGADVEASDAEKSEQSEEMAVEDYEEEPASNE